MHTNRVNFGRIFSAIVAVVACLSCLSLVAKATADNVIPAVPEGYMLVEGDILVRADFVRNGARQQRLMNPAAPFAPAALWPSGVVPYEFDANVSQANRDKMAAAMVEWETVANIDFRIRSGDHDYVYIQNSTLNSSAVGRQGGRQIMNIANWNSRWIMAHELAHALGFWHEQSRADRDDFIRIDLNNVAQSNWHNFDIHTEANHYGPYDFDSVMHYGAFDFSTNGQRVITVRPPWDTEWQNRIGQRAHLSSMDQMIMSFLYRQTNWLFVDWDFESFFHDGSFLYPFQSFKFTENLLPENGTIWIQPGSYSAVGVYSKRMTLQAPLGNVTLGE